jgi:ribosomal RNA-processing protein 1
MLSSNPTKREVKLAKALVHPDKAVRDETFATVKAFVSSMSSVDDMEMLKLWKALYYCMWLSDKQPIQYELAASLGDLVFLFKKTKLSLIYIQMFYRILFREWTLLDQYRVNKFYYLMRVILNRSLTLAFQSNWSNEIMTQLTTILDIEVLTKRPNGIRYHVADIYLQEILTVTKGAIKTEQLILLLQPFFQSLIRADDQAYIDRVHKAVFTKFATDYAKENKLNASEGDAPHAYFEQVNTLAVQKAIFDMASSEETPERFRRRLYDLHVVFANTTKVPFVDEELGSVVMDSTPVAATVEETTPAPVAGKRKQREEPVVEETSSKATEEVVEEKKETKKKSKKSKAEETTPVTETIQEEKKSTPKEETPVTTEETTTKEKKTKAVKKTVTESATTTTTTNTETPAVAAPVKTPATKAPESEESNDGNKKKKAKKGSEDTNETAAAPAAAPSAPVELAEYIAAKKFEGRKDGYVFKKVRRALFLRCYHT